VALCKDVGNLVLQAKSYTVHSLHPFNQSCCLSKNELFLNLKK